jgi:hypothetical protein
MVRIFPFVIAVSLDKATLYPVSYLYVAYFNSRSKSTAIGMRRERTLLARRSRVSQFPDHLSVLIISSL